MYWNIFYLAFFFASFFFELFRFRGCTVMWYTFYVKACKQRQRPQTQEHIYAYLCVFVDAHSCVSPMPMCSSTDLCLPWSNSALLDDLPSLRDIGEVAFLLFFFLNLLSSSFSSFFFLLRDVWNFSSCKYRNIYIYICMGFFF